MTNTEFRKYGKRRGEKKVYPELSLDNKSLQMTNKHGIRFGQYICIVLVLDLILVLILILVLFLVYCSGSDSGSVSDSGPVSGLLF